MSIYIARLHGRSVPVIILALLIVAGTPLTTSGHELKVDGDISAVMHTDPDDNPVTGSPTKFFIEFKDSANKFSLSKCNCRFSIVQNGTVLSTERLAVSSKYESNGSYTFKNPATYTMRFSGTPKTPGNFQPFILNYRVPVADGKPDAQSMPAALWGSIGVGVGLILVASFLTNHHLGKRKAPATSSNS